MLTKTYHFYPVPEMSFHIEKQAFDFLFFAIVNQKSKFSFSLNFISYSLHLHPPPFLSLFHFPLLLSSSSSLCMNDWIL